MTKLTKEERKQYWKLYYKKRYGGKEGRARKAAEMKAYRLKLKLEKL